MRAKFVVGNWKMNGGLASNAVLLGAIGLGVKGVDIAVMAPFPYLGQCAELLRGRPVSWGGQDVSEHASGAFTGEVSGSMLRELGCRHVLVGHSERRAYHGETSEQVARKAVAAHRVGLIPIICVGETLRERDSGQTEDVLRAQLRAVVEGAGGDVLRACVFAYEPVWAIGTGKTASPEQAQAVHAFIRGQLAREDAGMAESRLILYGGSVKSDNARPLFSMPDVDGGLVGGASLNASEFLSICRAATSATAQ